MLRAAGAKGLKTFQADIDGKFSPRSLILKQVRVEGDVELTRKTYQLKNLTAYLPGHGWHANEFIVIGAHYDHLGRGGFGSRSPQSHEIHNGADDNASGSAALLELARIFSQSDHLGRSLLFVAFSAEEEGLIGSKYWVEHPPVPLKKIVAMINLDMVGRLKNDKLLIGGIATAAPFADIVKQADAGTPLKISEMWKTGIAPSDNTSFVLRRIPVLFLWTGTHEDYHRPTDKADKINYPGEAEIINVAAKIVAAISLMDTAKLKFVEMPGPRRSRPTLR